MSAFATADDILLLKTLTADQLTKADALLEKASDLLRYEAKKVGKDLDEMSISDPTFASVLASVTANIVSRAFSLSENTEISSLSQYSQSALGYSFSGTNANPGESLFIKRNELKTLGLRRQRYGALEVY